MTITDPSENLYIAFDLMVYAAKNHPQLTDRQLRNAFTHWLPESLIPYNMFTGMVSEKAVAELVAMKGKFKKDTLVREHREKQQKMLTAFIGDMRKSGEWDFHRLEARVRSLGPVNITTKKENSDLSKKDATYENLGIRLIRWESLTAEVRNLILKNLMRGIANAWDFQEGGCVQEPETIY